MIIEIKWIDSNVNPTDTMMKGEACNTLRDLINMNKINLSTKE